MSRSQFRSFNRTWGRRNRIDPRIEVRRIRTDNLIKFKKTKIRIGKPFKGQPIGLRSSETEGLYEVFYCQQRIGWIDLRDAEKSTDRNLCMIRQLDE